MSDLSAEPTPEQRLRIEAERRLKHGTTEESKAFTLSSEALSVLYQLACSPESAAEGLKLLHELQTYQVELDLQNEQLLANELDSVKRLTLYQALYEFAPLGYFVTGPDGQIRQSNVACSSLFDVEPEDFPKYPVDSLLQPESRPAFFSLLQELLKPGARASCVVQSALAMGGRMLRLDACAMPGSQHMLIMVSELDPKT